MSKNNKDQDDIVKTSDRNVVITGFGLFRGHQLNPSWACIDDDQFKIDIPGLNIVKRQINVSYGDVDNVIPNLWKIYNPLLMVHIGLAAHETAIRIEEVARHGPYINDDVFNCTPHKHLRSYDEGGSSLEEGIVRHNYTCKPCDFNFSTTCLDIDRVCERVNRIQEEGKFRLRAKKSTEAGLYLCEYIYQKSLRICDRTVFIHVPDIKNFSLDEIRIALEFTIKVLIEEASNMVEKR